MDRKRTKQAFLLFHLLDDRLRAVVCPSKGDFSGVKMSWICAVGGVIGRDSTHGRWCALIRTRDGVEGQVAIEARP